LTCDDRDIRRLRRDARRNEELLGAGAGGADDDALDTKTRDLIAQAFSVATRCDGCIAFHAEVAMKQGATRADVLETMGRAVYMGAAPSLMYVAPAMVSFDQFSAKTAPRAAWETLDGRRSDS
jgi:AhpD family alkylhydroperoxidase